MTVPKWNIRNVYLYLVCLITLIMLIVAVINLGNSLLGLVYPEPPYYIEKPVAPTPEDETRWEDQRELQQSQQRYYSIKRSIESLIMIVIVLPIYMYHWRKIEAEQSSDTGSSQV